MRLLAIFCFLIGTFCIIAVPGTLLGEGAHAPTLGTWSFEVAILMVGLMILFGSAFCWSRFRSNELWLQGKDLSESNGGSGPLLRYWGLSIAFSFAVVLMLLLVLAVHG